MQYLYRLDNEDTWKPVNASSLSQAAEHAALREVGPSAMAFVLRIWVRGEGPHSTCKEGVPFDVVGGTVTQARATGAMRS